MYVCVCNLSLTRIKAGYGRVLYINTSYSFSGLFILLNGVYFALWLLTNYKQH